MIWLVGNRGMLGRAVERALRQEAFDFVVSDAEVDITDRSTLSSFAERNLSGEQDPSANHVDNWIINCAAYTAVDRAEEEPAAAAGINSLGPKLLAGLAADFRAHLLHISTDYVFDGTKRDGYTEDDRPGARSVYGRTKWAGEAAVAHFCPHHYIVRTSWMFGNNGRSFVTAMLERFRAGSEVRVVEDQWGCPTYAADLAEAILRFLRASGSVSPGIYHFANRGVTNWYDFAREIYTQACLLGLCAPGSTIVPVSSEQYPTPAERPAISVLHTEKIAHVFDLEIATYQDALHRYLMSLQS
jgi:dTDP-4-dehydrorhamnose reductase